jgi:enamine deaminase RidA (YjgF/YER057c/UK114 family)
MKAMGRIEKRLAELGLVIPEAAPPVATYVPFVHSGSLVLISGQVSIANGALIKGALGADLSLEDGIAAAHACGVNLIAQMKAACGGDLDRVRRVVRLGGFVNCTADFTDHPKVINGASDLMVEVFGDVGKHCRAAVGAPSLPLGAAVEIEATIEIA